MNDPIATLVTLLKLSPALLGAFALIVASMLWGPGWYIAGLGLEPFIEGQRKYLGVGFLILLASSLTPALVIMSEKVNNKLRIWRLLHRGKARLHNLTPEEISVVLQFTENESRSQSLEIDSGITIALVEAGIIHPALFGGTQHTFEQTYDGMMGQYNMSDWAWDCLKKNKKLMKSGD